MKLFKKNQVIIYVIALMLVVAGYLNFTADNNLNSAVLTSSSEAELDKMANIGDAQLVSSNVVSEENSTQENISNANTETNTNNTIVTSSSSLNNDNEYFSKSKLERDTMYSQQLETYENILNSSNSLETQKQSATEEIKKINDIKNGIMICENLIKTKGFEDVVIFVNGDSVNVIVKDEQLAAEKVAQIQNIISRELNAKVENIHISNK